MSAQAFGNDQMRTYLADALAAADSPLTVMPHDPEDPWGVLFRDTRFQYSFMSVRQDRLMGLLDTRTPEAVARGLEYRSAVGEIAMALTEYPEDWYTVDTYRGAELETVSFISWALYAVFLHARATSGWGPKKAAWFNIAGFLVLIFNLFFINIVVSGLHSYAGV